MNRVRTLFLLLSLALVLPIVTGTLLAAASSRAEDPGEDSLYKYLSVFTDVLSLVRQAYVDEADLDALMAGALDGTTDALDPFSVYVPARRVATFLEARAVGRRYSGLEILKDRGVAYVQGIEPGSPAAATDTDVMDVVTKINGRSTRLMPLWEIQEILAGKPGTKVELEVMRLGEPKTIAFELRPFEAPAPTVEAVRDVPVLRISGFDRRTVAAVRGALEQLAARREGRLLVDLRGVAGGEPEIAYEVAELFARGPLGALESRGNRLETFQGDAAPVWTGRAVVLVDRGTLGPAEILATVLRQKAGVEIVGERTFGHAGRLAIAELSSGGRLLHTDAFYTGPDEEPIDESLKPDLLVTERTRSFGEKDAPLEDLILQRGLKHLLGEDAEQAKKAA